MNLTAFEFCRTPPYKNLDIEEKVKVFIELVRPSDHARSEPKEFLYTPSGSVRAGVKRQRQQTESSSSSYSGLKYSSGEIPTTVQSLTKSMKCLSSNSLDLQEAMKDVNSEEFERVFREIFPELPPGPADYAFSFPELSSDMHSLAVDGPLRSKQLRSLPDLRGGGR